MGFLIFDLVSSGIRIFGRIRLSPEFRASGTGIVMGLVVLTMAYGVFHVRNIQTAHYNISLKKAGSLKAQEPLRITFVSDLHIGSIVNRKWLAGIVDAVIDSKPDLICIAGDIFESNIETMPDPEAVTEELRRLKAPLGVYACAGNHDVDRLSFREAGTTSRIQGFLQNAGIIFLQDDVQLIDGRFYLAGRRDARPIGGIQGRKSAVELSADLDSSLPLIFLDHQPVDFLREEEAGADLILSGHTHRGQLFPASLVTAYIYRKAGAVDYGHWQGTTAQAIVSSGAGVWGIPLRIATDSEAAVVDLRFGDQND
jgi:predicted MPP superfamily phosphohydrolase